MVGLCLLLFVLVFIIFMYLQGIEVPNVVFGLAGALIGILTKCILIIPLRILETLLREEQIGFICRLTHPLVMPMFMWMQAQEDLIIPRGMQCSLRVEELTFTTKV